jgi:hypothetical protein
MPWAQFNPGVDYSKALIALGAALTGLGQQKHAAGLCSSLRNGKSHKA